MIRRVDEFETVGPTPYTWPPAWAARELLFAECCLVWLLFAVLGVWEAVRGGMSGRKRK